MRVARLHGVGDIRLSDEPAPSVAPGESRVRVTSVGLCGSDLHWFTEGGIGDAVVAQPLVLGHEFAGVVEGGPLDGRRVALDPARPCHRCARCLEGNRNLCPHVEFAGHGSTDGGLRELVAWPNELLHPVPDRFSGADAAMLEPLGVALHAYDLGHPRIGATVAVVGCGPIGLCLVQLARASAATVVAVEPLAHRRSAARSMGAHVVLDPADELIHDELLRATRGQGVDIAFDVSGTDDAVALAMEAVRPGGQVVLVGIPDDDSTTFRASVARRKGLTIKMSRRMKEVYPRAIRLVDSGAVDVGSIVTSSHPLSSIDEAFRVASAREGLKVVVNVQE